MITSEEVRQIVHALIPYDTGNMFLNGVRIEEDETQIRVVFDVETVEYIIYQHLGFKHYLTGEFVDKNQGFIDDMVDAINDMIVKRMAGMDASADDYCTPRKRYIGKEQVRHRALHIQQNALEVATNNPRGY